MKKIFSLVLSGMIVFSSFLKANAAGIDKEETLSDGTKIIYVSSEKIPDKLKEFEQQAREIYEMRYSTNKNLAIKGIALSTATAGIYALNKFGSGSAISVVGQLALALAGLAGFFYPDYRDCQLGRKLGCGGCDDREGYDFAFNGTAYGFGKKVYGINDILIGMNTYSSTYKIHNDADGYFRYGIAIVLRPYEKETGDTCESFSGMYNQDEMLNDNNKKWEKSVRAILIDKINEGK